MPYFAFAFHRCAIEENAAWSLPDWQKERKRKKPNYANSLHFIIVTFNTQSAHQISFKVFDIDTFLLFQQANKHPNEQHDCSLKLQRATFHLQSNLFCKTVQSLCVSLLNITIVQTRVRKWESTINVQCTRRINELQRAQLLHFPWFIGCK